MKDLLADAEAELYAADPDGFTARRAELAASARDAGELAAARARLVDELTRAALRAAELSAPPAALREEVTATLDAAIADPGVAAGLGTLVRAAHYAGFGLAPLADGPPAPPRAKQAKAPAETVAEREDRRQEKIKTAERSLADADHDLEAALAAERDHQDNVRRLEAGLAGARQRLAEARQQRAAQQLSRLKE